MNKMKKTLLMTLGTLCLIVATVFGTLAYLTDTESVANTFTVGHVGLSLQETGMTDSDNDGVFGKAYHLLPGQTYEKDPTVTVDAKSEESYVRMIVMVQFENGLTDAALAIDLDNIFIGYDAAKWERNAKAVSSDNKTIAYEYRYYTTVTGGDTDNQLEPLFTGFTIPGEYTNEQIAVLDGMTIDVQAHAIQAAGFDTADDAWTAFNEQAQADPIE